jgi:hypothetical protein
VEVVPAQAVGAGYTNLTFRSTFDRTTVDTNVTKDAGFKWYNWDLFGYRSDPNSIQLNQDGTVTLLGDSTGSSGQLVSAVQAKNTKNYVGSSFGGGAYVEAQLKFDPLSVSTAPGTAIWPAFWALQMEGNIFPKASQWPGQPAGYVHSIEADFFEAIRNPVGMPANSYGASLHDWYGIYNITCGTGLCQVAMPYTTGMRVTPVGTDFTQYHRYGFLWVPATSTNNGFARFYFDGVQVGPTQAWQAYINQPPPPTNQPWAFGIIDKQHLFLILSTGLHQQMTVREVDVWQGDTAANDFN